MKCKVNDLQVHYEIRGEGQPILILHGALISHFEPIFEQLTGWQRIYVDYPGIRQTAVPDWVQSADDILEVVDEWIGKILGTDRFLLAGFSYSSYLARGILKKRIDQVEGIALICPVIHADFANRTIPEEMIIFQDQEEIAQLSEKALQDLEGYVVQNKAIWQRIQEDQDEESNSMNRDFFNHLKKTGRYAFRSDPDDLDVPFAKPTLIIAGRQDYVVGYEDSLKILRNYPRATYVILDMAGHMLMIEQEELFTSLVMEWLDRVTFANPGAK